MTRVKPYAGSDISHGVAVIDKMRKDTSGWKESSGTRQARKVFEMQQELLREGKPFPTNVLDTDTLPGRVSLVSHITEFCIEERAWSPLLRHARWLNAHRIPHTNTLKAVMEITVGVDSPEKLSKAIAWVEGNLRRDLELL
jgi:hypothetical protein